MDQTDKEWRFAKFCWLLPMGGFLFLLSGFFFTGLSSHELSIHYLDVLITILFGVYFCSVTFGFILAILCFTVTDTKNAVIHAVTGLITILISGTLVLTTVNVYAKRSIRGRVRPQEQHIISNHSSSDAKQGGIPDSGNR